MSTLLSFFGPARYVMHVAVGIALWYKREAKHELMALGIGVFLLNLWHQRAQASRGTTTRAKVQNFLNFIAAYKPPPPRPRKRQLSALPRKGTRPSAITAPAVTRGEKPASASAVQIAVTTVTCQAAKEKDEEDDEFDWLVPANGSVSAADAATDSCMDRRSTCQLPSSGSCSTCESSRSVRKTAEESEIPAWLAPLDDPPQLLLPSAEALEVPGSLECQAGTRSSEQTSFSGGQCEPTSTRGGNATSGSDGQASVLRQRHFLRRLAKTNHWWQKGPAEARRVVRKLTYSLASLPEEADNLLN